MSIARPISRGISRPISRGIVRGDAIDPDADALVVEIESVVYSLYLEIDFTDYMLTI